MYAFILLALTLLFFSACAIDTKTQNANPSLKNYEQTSTKVVTSNAGWVPIFFESIESLTQQMGITNLKKKKVDPDSFEIRIWKGFGLTYLEGVVLKKEKEKWTGYYIAPISHRELTVLEPPSSGWEQLWKELERLELTSLPDSSELKDEAMVLDGTSYVFEILTAKEYRTYMYSNPKYQKWLEAKKVIAIDRLLRKEFGQM